jgi:flavin-dependent dehydrogenase
MVAPEYDVIVVGARAAGSATAMLLARQGLSVLALDRARFPSDTLSTHQVQLPGVARLARWGLLRHLDEAGTPAVDKLTVDLGHTVLAGTFPTIAGASSLYSPRRTVLDQILVTAARQAGAEVREGFVVDELVFDAGRVAGIAGRHRGGARRVERSALVVGADGKHSLVARTVAAKGYREHRPATFACYSYWSEVDTSGGALYHRPGRAAAIFPTNDGLTMALAIAPAAEFGVHRHRLEAHYLETLSGFGDVGERLRAGRRAERLRTVPELPQTFRTAYGPGWALVGDAGLVLDPITAQGISNAFRDAELLAAVVAANVHAGRPADHGLRGYSASATPLPGRCTRSPRRWPGWRRPDDSSAGCWPPSPGDRTRRSCSSVPSPGPCPLTASSRCPVYCGCWPPAETGGTAATIEDGATATLPRLARIGTR